MNSSSGSPPVAKIHAQTSDDVADVPLSLFQVDIFTLIEHGGDFSKSTLERGSGIQLFGADDLGGTVDEHRIVEHQQLRVEQIRVLGARRFGDPLADVLQLLARLLAGLSQQLDFALDARRGNAEAKIARASPQYQRLANADSR